MKRSIDHSPQRRSTPRLQSLTADGLRSVGFLHLLPICAAFQMSLPATAERIQVFGKKNKYDLKIPNVTFKIFKATREKENDSSVSLIPNIEKQANPSGVAFQCVRTQTTLFPVSY